MQKFTETITASQGGTLVPLAGASVAVYNAGTSVLATLYSNNAGAAQANPVTSSATGLVAFYAPDGRYDIVATKAGFTPVTIGDVLFEDPADGVITNIEGAVIVDSTLDGTVIGATTPDEATFTKVKFVPNGVTPPEVGEIRLNVDENTLDVGLGGGVIGQMFEETYIAAVNGDTTPFVSGEVVQFSGVDADRPVATRAVADSSYFPLYTLGVVTQDIAVSGSGKVTSLGKVRDVNTTGSAVSESWAVGDILYIHPTVAGALTNVEPLFPNIAVPMAAVLVVSPTAGVLLVRPTLHARIGSGRFIGSSPSGIALPSSTWTSVPVADVGTASLLTVDGSGAVVVGKTGRYAIDFAANYVSSTSSSVLVRVGVSINGTLTNGFSTTVLAGALAAGGTTLRGTFTENLTAGDYLSPMAYASGSTNVSVKDIVLAGGVTSYAAAITLSQVV